MLKFGQTLQVPLATAWKDETMELEDIANKEIGDLITEYQNGNDLRMRGRFKWFSKPELAHEAAVVSMWISRN